MRRFVLAICLALAALALPLTVSAKAPETFHYTQNPPDLTVSGVCAFDFTIHSTLQTTEVDYFNGSGVLTRMYFHTTEQDTFTGPGGSLTTSPYTYNLEARFNSAGDYTGFVASGVILRTTLPDGSLFLSAGRINVLAHPGIQFSLVPDFGHSGNLDAFCAALA
jgi:hypothetical protein